MDDSEMDSFIESDEDVDPTPPRLIEILSEEDELEDYENAAIIIDESEEEDLKDGYVISLDEENEKKESPK